VHVVFIQAHRPIALAAEHDIEVPGELERKRRDGAARRTFGHELRYSLMRADYEEEFALVLPFV